MPSFRDDSIVAIIQARMGSSRLPGKVMKEIGGTPMLFHVVLRVRRSQYIGRVIVATTYEPGDDPVADYCRQQGIPCYRGHPQDVLDRYYQAAKRFHAQTVVRLTADCPLIDPREIDRTVAAFLESGVDFAANRLPAPWQRTTPIGMDTEVVSLEALTSAWKNAQADYEREHVMPYMYDQEGRFEILLVQHDPDWGQFRLTVDTPEDLELVRCIVDHFNGSNEISLIEIIRFLEAHPEVHSINANTAHKSFTDVDERYTGVLGRIDS